MNSFFNKTFQEKKMHLDFLPNEVFLDLFDYFDGIELLRIFFNLNLRFNLLLCEQHRFYHLNFRLQSKYNLDLLCKKHLPFIAKQLCALQCSDEFECSRKLKYFLSHIKSMKQFTHLRSIT